MENFEMIDLLPLQGQMTLVVFQNPDTRKGEVQILPVSLKTTEFKVLQGMLEIPAEPKADGAAVSVEVEESLSCKILNWCKARDITSEQLVRAFISFCGKPENADILKAWIQQEIAREKIDIEKFSFVTREELEQDTDAIMERVNAGESPILILNEGKADSLLFGWEDYLRRFSTLHTAEEIAEVETACSEMKKTLG